MKRHLVSKSVIGCSLRVVHTVRSIDRSVGWVCVASCHFVCLVSVFVIYCFSLVHVLCSADSARMRSELQDEPAMAARNVQKLDLSRPSEDAIVIRVFHQM